MRLPARSAITLRVNSTTTPGPRRERPRRFAGARLGAKRSGSRKLLSVPGVGFELQHQRFWPVSLDIAQVPDQDKREFSRSDNDALYPAVTRRL
jgi:hypothetical protein